MKYSSFALAAIALIFSITSQAAPNGYIVFHNTQDLNDGQLCVNMSPLGSQTSNQNISGCIGAQAPNPELSFSQPTTIIPLMVFFRTANYGAQIIHWPIQCAYLYPPQVATVTVTDAQGDYHISC